MPKNLEVARAQENNHNSTTFANFRSTGDPSPWLKWLFYAFLLHQGQHHSLIMPHLVSLILGYRLHVHFSQCRQSRQTTEFPMFYLDSVSFTWTWASLQIWLCLLCTFNTIGLYDEPGRNPCRHRYTLQTPHTKTLCRREVPLTYNFSSSSFWLVIVSCHQKLISSYVALVCNLCIRELSFYCNLEVVRTKIVFLNFIIIFFKSIPKIGLCVIKTSKLWPDCLTSRCSHLVPAFLTFSPWSGGSNFTSVCWSEICINEARSVKPEGWLSVE